MSIAEALLKSDNGRTLVVKVQTRNQETADRIRQLKELVYQAVMVSPREGYPRRKDLYEAAKINVRKIAIEGGSAFTNACTRVKFMWNSKEDWKTAVDMLTK